MKNINEIKTLLNAIDRKEQTARSAWGRGVCKYAAEMIADLSETSIADPFANRATLKAALLNGAENEAQYSEGGCALIYDGDICERLCSPSEQKKRHGGDWNPSRYETWLDVQTRAIKAALRLILNAAKSCGLYSC